MSQEKGNLSINSENILPIIKKWLYSDTDIFVRELVSNAADAITKLERLSAIGEASVSDDEAFCIRVVLDKEAKTIKIVDNGIGMTADEIKQYINQIAFSGATDFMNKYKDKMDAENEIIGHFGLGFYSAFMVAEKVEIDTLSYREGEEAAKWTCDGGIEFEITESGRTERGTEITLFITEDSKDFLDDYKLRSILKKYCGFIPVDIFFENEATKKAEAEKANEVKEAVEGGEADDTEEKAKEAPKPVNEKSPLWLKKPNDCTDEDYKKFYHQVFSDFNEPLFWIHLNMDYPFKLKGILYFPKLKHELESIEGQVKLFSNQVFIADNIKEVIPEFLLLLKGVMDCPELPLNVSRSFLQNDGYVTKMSGYITKKVADKLTSLCKNERETYDKYWDDINQFIKYGCIREEGFYDKCKAGVLYKTTKGEYLTITEYLERNEPKTGKKIFYATNQQQQSQYIKLFEEQDIDCVLLETKLDNPFMSYVERGEEGTTFSRIDSDLSEAVKDVEGETDEVQKDELTTLFKNNLGNDKLKIEVEGLKSPTIPAIIILSEESRRMQEMTQMFGGGMNFGMPMEVEEKLVLNQSNTLVKSLLDIKDDADKAEDVKMICEQIYDLAMMSHKPLGVDAMNKFIERSNKILTQIVEK